MKIVDANGNAKIINYTGAGSTNKIAKWSSTNALTTSQITDDGTNVTCAGTYLGLTGLFPRFIYGLPLSYTDSTHISVGSGYARDTTDYATMSLTSDSTIGSAGGGIGASDFNAVSGTVATNSGTKVVTGTSTTFLTAFGTRSGSGTITGVSTTITGTSTKFLTEVAVGDLIGTNAKGYSRVTAIASDTSLTISLAIPGGSPAGTTPVIIENAWIQVAAQTIQRIDSITSDTQLNLPANSSATQSGQTLYIGVLPVSQTYLVIWLRNGTGGTGVCWSTQRTIPYSIINYNTYYRRIGSVIWSGSAFCPFDQYGYGIDRWCQFECGEGDSGGTTFSTSVLSNGTATSWTAIVCSGVAPPAARCLIVHTRTGLAVNLYVRARGVGTTDLNRNAGDQNPVTSGGQRLVTNLHCACDGAQCIDYVLGAGTASSINIGGYMESL